MQSSDDRLLVLKKLYGSESEALYKLFTVSNIQTCPFYKLYNIVEIAKKEKIKLEDCKFIAISDWEYVGFIKNVDDVKWYNIDSGEKQDNPELPSVGITIKLS